MKKAMPIHLLIVDHLLVVVALRDEIECCHPRVVLAHKKLYSIWISLYLCCGVHWWLYGPVCHCSCVILDLVLRLGLAKIGLCRDGTV